MKDEQSCGKGSLTFEQVLARKQKIETYNYTKLAKYCNWMNVSILRMVHTQCSTAAKRNILDNL